MPNGSDPLKLWLDTFPYEAVKVEMEDVQTQLNTLGQRYGELQDAIRLYERHRSGLPVTAVTPPETDSELFPTVPTSDRPRTHSIGAVAVLKEAQGKPMTLRELTDLFRSRGWIRPEVKNGKEIMRGVMRRLDESNPYVRLVAANPVAYAYSESEE
jgi:hypothetical protein